MISDASFGRWLSARRHLLDLTQDELARQVGCAVTTIRKLEANERRHSKQIAERLAESLEIAPADRPAFVSFARSGSPPEVAARPSLVASFLPSHPLPRRTDLAMPLTPLFGRTQDIASVRNLLLQRQVRLLTLIGSPGIGKTRLAIAVAGELQDAFADGVHLVALAPISDPDLVIPTVAQTLGVAEVGTEPVLETMKRALADRQLLLVLDNFEQVVPAATAVAELLIACQRLMVVVTSRVALRVRGERLYPVPPLLLPDLAHLPPLEDLACIPTVALFLERAQAVMPGFAIGEAHAAAVAEICVRLDGLPLAIELSAARIRVFPPDVLLARLSDPLKLLTGGARDLPARQQTLRAMIDWSYQLLDPVEQVLFTRLGVFVGGCALDAAEAICVLDANLPIDVVDGIESLLDKSLLRQEAGPDGAPRYTMLELIRGYTLERLAERGEADAIRQQHAIYFLELAEEAEPWIRFMRPERDSWLARLGVEQDNLRAALEWFAAREEAEFCLRLASALQIFWRKRFHWGEGRTWLEAALAKSSNMAGAARAKALIAAAGLTFSLGDLTTARAYAEGGLALLRALGDKAAIAYALWSLGNMTVNTGDYVMARACAEESLALFDELSDSWGRAYALVLLVRIAFVQGDLTQATVYNEEILTFYRQVGYKRGVGFGLNDKGVFAQLQGDWERAAAFYAEGLALFREVGDKEKIAMGLHNFGGAVLHQGDARRAATCFAEGLTLSREVGDRSGIAVNLAGMAGVMAALGQPDRSARLFGAANALFDVMGMVVEPVDRIEYDRNREIARAQLGEEAFPAAWAEGRAMPLEQAIAYALQI